MSQAPVPGKFPITLRYTSLNTESIFIVVVVSNVDLVFRGFS